MLPATIAIRTRSDLVPVLGIVLGSGFAALTNAIHTRCELAFSELSGFPQPSVPGHPGRLLLGHLAGLPVAVLAGRAHYYEGHPPDTVVLPTRTLAELGIRSLLLTNAAGGIRDDLQPGDLVSVTDHVNLMGFNPLRGPGGAERFVDLSEVYSSRLRARLRGAAVDSGVVLKEGVYAAVSGPSYETPAEIRALRTLGADLVGMSTVPEAIVARQLGIEVAALSCVTNKAAGLGGAISHAEVIQIGRRVSDTVGRLVIRFAEQLAAESRGPEAVTPA